MVGTSNPDYAKAQNLVEQHDHTVIEALTKVLGRTPTKNECRQINKRVQRHRGPTQAPAAPTYETYVVSSLLLLGVLCEAAAAVEEGDPAQNSSAGSAASEAATNSTERDAGGQSSEASTGGDEGTETANRGKRKYDEQGAHRRKPDQVNKDNAQYLKNKTEYDERYSQATLDVEKLIKLRGKSNKQSPELKEFRHKNFEDIRSHHNIHHTVRNLKDAVKNGRAGEGPLKMGPIQGVLPDCMFTYMRTAIQKGQIVGLELNSKRRGLLLRSFYENTEYEKDAQGRVRNVDNVKASFGKSVAAELQTGKAKTAESHRAAWANAAQYEEWVQGWEAQLLALDFAFRHTDEQVYVYADKLHRIINIDETGLPLDGESRSDATRNETVFFDPDLPHNGKPTTKGQGHATLFAGTTALGETLPHTLIFTTGAENPANNSVPENILDHLPKVKGQFGLSEVREHNCRVASSPKGGTNDLMFNSYLDLFIELYPDRSAANPVLVKTDGGPGRTNPENLAKARENNIILFPGFPNGSGFNQEQDALYAEFKRLLTLAFEELEAERCQGDTTATKGSVEWIPPTAGVAVTITSNDFPKVLPKALDKAFRPEAVKNAWGKIGAAGAGSSPLGPNGAVPVTRASLFSAESNLRPDPDNQESKVNKKLARIEDDKKVARAACISHGLNTSALDKLHADIDKLLLDGKKVLLKRHQRKHSEFRTEATLTAEVTKVWQDAICDWTGHMATGGLFEVAGPRALTSDVIYVGLLRRANKKDDKAEEAVARKDTETANKMDAAALVYVRKKPTITSDLLQSWNVEDLKTLTRFAASAGVITGPLANLKKQELLNQWRTAWKDSPELKQALQQAGDAAEAAAEAKTAAEAAAEAKAAAEAVAAKAATAAATGETSAAGGDGTAAAAEESDKRTQKKRTRNPTVKTGTGVHDAGELAEANRVTKEADRVAKVQKMFGTFEKQGKQVTSLKCTPEERARLIAILFGDQIENEIIGVEPG